MSEAVERRSRPGHDRDCALAMYNQARNTRQPLDEIQVEHLLLIGYTAGWRAAVDAVEASILPMHRGAAPTVHEGGTGNGS